MKLPLSWLADHIHLRADIDIKRLAEAMTMAGIEVEAVEDRSAKLAAFSVARVIEATRHPNADKLQVCLVDTKDGRKEIVCGAPNARAGMRAIYAPIGTYIPGTGVTLEPKPVRGVVSHGMLCSARELEIGEDHDGIIDLAGDWRVGDAAARALGLNDPVLDLALTPNRPDWLGAQGVARDLAACGLGVFRDEPIAPVPGGFPCPVRIALDATDACPVFAGRVIIGLKNGPSPSWLQEKLRAVGLKPRSALVDVTNYLSLDRCRPLHVYDVSKLEGPVRARLGREGESFLALDEKTYAVTPDMCVIADDARVLGLGGVMGGAYSGARAETTAAFIESAWFDPARTARTGRATGIQSDAQYRFARGVDPHSCVPGLEIATRLILDMCGGAASEILLAGAPPAPPAPIAFDPARLAKLSGLDLPEARMRDILAALGFEVSRAKKAGKLAVRPPSWRRDAEGPADLVEEIVRVHGYDKLPPTRLTRAAGRRPPAVTPQQRRVQAVRHALAARGMQEAITWSFCLHDHAKLFGGGAEELRLANPISSELDGMRPSALIHLARALQRNADRGFPGATLFEVGPIYRGVRPEDQRMAAAGARLGRLQRHWEQSRAPDIYDAKADALAALEAAGAPVAQLQVAPASDPWWSPGRSGAFKLGPKTTLGVFGELHPRTLRALDVEGPVIAFELDLDALPPARVKASKSKGALALSDLMPVRRDFAFVVDRATPAGDLVRAAAGADRALVADVAVFDVFESEALGAGKKSVAIEVTLQPKEATLDEAALETASNKIVGAVLKATGGALRA